MRKELADKARLQHVLEAIGEIEKYTSGFSVETFLADSKTHFATIKQLEIIGEAANQLSSDLLAKFGEIEWRSIRSFRNILVHEYFNVRLADVWETVLSDLPPLKETVKIMLQKFT